MKTLRKEREMLFEAQPLTILIICLTFTAIVALLCGLKPRIISKWGEFRADDSGEAEGKEKD